MVNGLNAWTKRKGAAQRATNAAGILLAFPNPPKKPVFSLMKH